MNLDGFSMHRLAEELSAALVGGRIDKVTQPNRQTIQIGIRQPGENLLLYISINPQNPTMYIIERPLENPPEPPSFCMLLRKNLETGRISRIEQVTLDRVMMIDIDTIGAGGRIVTKTLACEFMGKYSNVILVEDGIIIDALRKVGTTSSRVRLVLPNIRYELPPSKEKLNALRVTAEDIVRRIKAYRRDDEKKDMRLVAALSDVCVGFGPVTTREIAHVAGLSPDAPISSLDEVDYVSLAGAIGKTVAALENRSGTDLPVIVLDKNKKICAISAYPVHYIDGEKAERFDTMSAMLARATELMGSYVPPDKERYKKLVKNEISKAANKIKKLKKEEMDAENADEARVIADNLQTYQYTLTDHADSRVTLKNIYSETGEEIAVTLDQSITISQNIQKYYKKYNKLKRAKNLIKEQIESCEENIGYLMSIDASLESSETLAEIGDIGAELIEAGYLAEKPRKKKFGEKPSEPMKFTAPDGCVILVGKNNSQNDRLTFKIARKGDLWLHTKDIPGSHVILKNNGEADFPKDETLTFAARLAAKFSTASEGSNVPVDIVPAEQIKKPGGAKPGFVIFTGQRTIYVTPDDETRSETGDIAQKGVSP